MEVSNIKGPGRFDRQCRWTEAVGSRANRAARRWGIADEAAQPAFPLEKAPPGRVFHPFLREQSWSVMVWKERGRGCLVSPNDRPRSVESGGPVPRCRPSPQVREPGRCTSREQTIETPVWKVRDDRCESIRRIVRLMVRSVEAARPMSITPTSAAEPLRSGRLSSGLVSKAAGRRQEATRCLRNGVGMIPARRTAVREHASDQFHPSFSWRGAEEDPGQVYRLPVQDSRPLVVRSVFRLAKPPRRRGLSSWSRWADLRVVSGASNRPSEPPSRHYAHDAFLARPVRGAFGHTWLGSTRGGISGGLGTSGAIGVFPGGGGTMGTSFGGFGFGSGMGGGLSVGAGVPGFGSFGSGIVLSLIA